MRTQTMRQYKLFCGVALCAMAINSMAPLAAIAADTGANDGKTTTPIKHVITIIGENRTFDHLFATYKPVRQTESVLNLLSQNIINDDGTPGPNYASAVQNKAMDTADVQQIYLNSPPKSGAYQSGTVPAPLASGGPPPFSKVSEALTFENGLPPGYYKYLTTGAVPAYLKNQPDMRLYYDGNDVSNLPSGPYQLTNVTTGNPTGPVMTYDDYVESPVHRFYQMWQQLDCSKMGCQNDLFTWVEATVGAGSNGNPPPANFTSKEGAIAMGFYNVQQGDMPYFKHLADTYSMSDNFHQSVQGGTGANHIMLGYGDLIWYSDSNGNPLTPPHNMMVGSGSTAGVVDEIENPNPLPGANNWYIQDGYGGTNANGMPFGGGSYTNCSDTSQPGVKALTDYLTLINVKPNCQQGRYYLLNNYNPGYFGDGTDAYAQINNPQNTVFTIPPSNVPNLANTLWQKNITFAYFGGQFNAYLADPYGLYKELGNNYCNICNFFQYSTYVMTDPDIRQMALQDTTDLYNDIQACTATKCDLPAVSFVKPDGYLDGHPASSKVNLLEGFVKKIVDMVKANPTLWGNTAIFVTMDEGGGYYDSGYVQSLDFFGDGTRIPLMVVSKYSTGGHISHSYTDHVSILKFIEANWSVPPITSRSRDNLPNPTTGADPYRPTNGPAIGDLMDLFKF